MWKISPSYRSVMNRWHLKKEMPWAHGDVFRIVPFEGDEMRGAVEFKCAVLDKEGAYELVALEPFTAKFDFIPDVIHLFHNDRIMGSYIVPEEAHHMKSFNLEVRMLMKLQKINMRRVES